jgi:hypothetical protein
MPATSTMPAVSQRNFRLTGEGLETAVADMGADTSL